MLLCVYVGGRWGRTVCEGGVRALRVSGVFMALCTRWDGGEVGKGQQRTKCCTELWGTMGGGGGGGG